MEKVVESVKISDDSMSELHGERLGLLEGRVKELEVRIESLEDDGELADGWAAESEDKLEQLEERVAVLHVQNIEYHFSQLFFYQKPSYKLVNHKITF